MMKMNKLYVLAAAGCFTLAVPAIAQQVAPITLRTQYVLTGAPEGHYDHMAIDLAGNRLFAANEGGAIEVVDLKSGKVIHAITDVKSPHDMYYSAGKDRLYVTDGDAAEFLIYDAKNYQKVGSVKLWDDLDPFDFDPSTHMFYLGSGGGDLHESFSHFSTVDADAAKLVNDMKIDGTTLEAMRLAGDGRLIYVNNRDKGQVNVVDVQKHQVMGTWPIQGATQNVAMALDKADHRLFIGCRSGQMVIFDTTNGKQLQMLPLTKGVDDMVYDRATRRVYASADGATDVFQQRGPDKYEPTVIKTEPLAKTSLLVPSLHRFFVAVPTQGGVQAHILVYQVH